MINGQKIDALSLAEVENIYYNDNLKEIDVFYQDKSGLHKVKPRKDCCCRHCSAAFRRWFQNPFAGPIPF
jgi:hypothetical protein